MKALISSIRSEKKQKYGGGAALNALSEPGSWRAPQSLYFLLTQKLGVPPKGFLPFTALCFAILLLWGAQLGAQVRYVAPTGNNANDGLTPVTPWQTVQHAVNTAPDNSNIQIVNGVYNEFVNFNVGKNLTFTSSGGAVTITGLTLNASGRTLTFVNAFTINNLVLLDGKINATGANLVTPQSPAIGNANSYIIGKLTIAPPAGTQTLFFPLGTTTDYLPLTLNNVSAPNLSPLPLVTFTGEIVEAPGSSVSANYAGGINRVSPVRYWRVVQANGTATAIGGVTLGFANNDLVFDPSNLRVAQIQGGAWQNMGPGSGPTGNTITATGAISSVNQLRFALANATGGGNFCNASLAALPNPTCANTPANISASFTAITPNTFTWTCDGCITAPPNTAGPHAISWASPGTKTVTLQAASPACTTSIVSALVTVNGASNTNGAISVSNNAVCDNNSPSNFTTTLSISGAPPPGAVFAWECDGCVSTTLATNTAGPHTVTWANQGVKTLSLAITSAGACPTHVTSVLVSVSPTPIADFSLSSASICLTNSISNNTVTLLTTGFNILPGATYTWNCDNCLTAPLSSAPSHTISWATTGAKTLQLTIQNPGIPACVSKTIQKTVIVNGLPSANFTVSNSNACLNQNITLSAQPTGIATYSWNCNGCAPFPTGALEDVSWNSLGPKNITLQVVDNNGCTSPAFNTTVTVNQLVAPNPVPTLTVCQGGSAILDAYNNVPAPNTTYLWSGPGGFNSSQRNPSLNNITAANAGFYTVIVSSPGCSSLSATVQVIVNQPISSPAATSNSPVCANSPINLTANVNVAAGTQFRWTGPGGYDSGFILNNPSASAPSQFAQGVYFYTLEVLVPGCAPVFGFTSVTVNQTPGGLNVSAPQTVCRGADLTLTASPFTPVNNLSYLWQGPGNYSSTQQNPTIANIATIATGVYSVTPIVPGCSNLGVFTTNITVVELPATLSASSNSPANAPLCAGQNIQLTATPTINNGVYTWQGPNGFGIIQQNPTLFSASTFNVGVYTVTFSAPGCANTVSATTTIGVLDPNGVTVTSNSPVCAGGQLLLTATELAGVTYQWSGPNGIFSGSRNPSFSGVSTFFSGLYNLTVTANSCGQTAFKSVFVTVNESPQTPTISTEKNPLCEGDELELTAAGNALGAFYAWSGPDGYFDFVQNPVIPRVTTANSGVYSVTAYLNGCSRTATLDVRVNPNFSANFAVGNNGPICSGNTLNLTATGIKGATYIWTGPNSFSVTQQNPILPDAPLEASGVYNLSVSIPGCGARFYSTAATVRSAPQPPNPTANGPLCEGNNLQLTAIATPGCAYSWVGPNGFNATTPNTNISNVTTAASGAYTVTVSNAGCPPQTGVVNVEIFTQPTAIAAANSPVCEGGVLIFTANSLPNATYRWQGPNFNVTQQNPLRLNASTAMSGEYLLTIRQEGCQDAVATLNVTVSPAPITPIATANSPVCTGNTLVLNSPQIAGLNYSWTGPNGFSANIANPSIPNVSINAAGEYLLLVSSPGCSPKSASVEVTVIEGPSNVQASSNSPICAGSTLELEATEIPNATYSWRGPNGFSAAGRNVFRENVSAAAAGNYTVTARVAGCAEASSVVAAAINNLPDNFTPRNSGPVCAGDFLRLTSINQGGASYEWTGPGGFTSTQPSPVIPNATEANSGSYSVTVTIPSCGSVSGVTSAVVYPDLNSITASSNSPVCQGQLLILSATLVAGATYQWQGPAGFRANGMVISVPVISQEQAGAYSVTVTLPGCSSRQASVAVTINSTGPFIPTNNGPICEGRTLNLSAPNINGVTYQWSGPGGFSSTQPNPVIQNATTANAGAYTVIINDPVCGTSTGVTEVVINREPGALTVNSNSPVCQGSILRLTASSSLGGPYMWSGPNGFSAMGATVEVANVSLNASGIYTVTLNAGGCGPRIGTVNVAITPQFGNLVAESNSPLCAGQTLLLTAPTIPGASYLWSGPAGFSSTLANPALANASPTLSGVYTVSVNTQCGNLTANTSVVVRPGVGNITAGNNGPLCSGNVLILTATGGSEGVYLWQGPNGFSSSLPNPVLPSVTTANSGVYTVTLQSASCGNATATTSVVVNPSIEGIQATNSGPACAGASINLAATNVAGATYTWRGPNGFMAEGSSVTLTNVREDQAGAYNVSVLLAGCGLITRTTNVVIAPPISNIRASNNGPGCLGGDLQLQASFYPGATYLWQGPNGFSATAQNPIVQNLVPASAGIYTVTINSPSCGSASASTTVVVSGSIPPIAATNNSPVCNGETLNFGVTSVEGAIYQWSGPSGFSSTLQSPSIPNAANIHGGVYSVTVRYSACPGSGRTVTTTANVLPGSPIASVSDPIPARICQGSSVNFEIQFDGVPPFVLTYAEGSNPPISVAVQGSPYTLRLTPNGTGSRTYSFGCQAITKSVEVAQGLQLSLASQTPANCSTGLGSLSVMAVGGTAPYVYTVNPAVAPPNTTGVFEGLGAGVYEITASDRNGCVAAASFTLEGVSSPAPVVEAVTSSSASLRWFASLEAQSYIVEYRIAGSGNSFLRANAVTGTSLVIEQLRANTLYEFRIIAVCGSGVQGLPSAITSAQTDIESAIGICQTPELYAPQINPNGNVRFSWRPNLSGAVCYIISYGRLNENPDNWVQFLAPHPSSSIFVTGIPVGAEYGVRIRTNCSMCSYNSGQITTWSPITRFTVGSRLAEGSNRSGSFTDLSIYPNPSSGFFSVKLQSPTAEAVQAKVFDLSGRIIFSQSLEAEIGENHWPLQLENTSGGVYILEVSQGSEIQRARIIVK